MSGEEAAAGIPFMITAAMKQKLRERGLTDEQIKNLKPEEARDFLAAKMSNPNSWRDDLSAEELAKLDELGEENVVRPEFGRMRDKFAGRFADLRKAKKEAEAKKEESGKPDRSAEYWARIEKLAALQDGSMRDYEREARKVAEEFETTKTAIDADVRKWRERHKPEEPDKDRLSQLQRLVRIGRAEILWHDGNGAGFVSIRVRGNFEKQIGAHFEHHPIKGGGRFEDWLRKTYSEKFTVNIGGEWIPQMPGSTALREAIEALHGHALDSDLQHPTSFRVARQRGAVFLDLGGPDWWAAKVTREGVFMERSPGMYRPSGQCELPVPGMGSGRGIEYLRRLVNVKKEDFILVVGYLIGVFSLGPFAILIVTGPEDSAKTTICRVIKRSVDPDAKDLRTPPKNIEDLMIAARHSRVVGYDNVSYISGEVSDAMCRLTSGGAVTKRALYTDGDEFSITACRPLLLNGIPDRLASRPDLLDRAILIKAPPMAWTDRKTEEEFWREFREVHTYILGALLEGVAGALRNAHKIDMKDEKPRLLGFVQWAEAGCQALGFAPGAFIEAYLTNRELAGGAAIEGNPVAQSVIMLAEQRPFLGTATELLERLKWLVLSRPDLRDQKFPTAPNHLSDSLRRLVRVLKYEGVEVLFDQRINRDSNRGIVVRKLPSKSLEELLAVKAENVQE
jgi:hypothetical protein